MIWESFDGSVRELDWGTLQDLANQAAHTLAARGVARGDRVAVVLPATPEAAAIFFGVWKLGAILLSMSVLYGDDGIQHRLSDSGARLLVTDPENAPRFDRTWAPDVLVLEHDTLAAASDRFRLRRHLGRRSGPALLHVRDDGARERDRARPPLHPRARGVPVLPRGYARRTLPRDGRVGLGSRYRPAAGPLAARGGPVRLPARGGLRPEQATRLPEPSPGDERLHDADRDALDDGDRRRRCAIPAVVSPRVLGRGAAQPRGDPLVSRAVRSHGARLLRAHRVLPARCQLSVPRGAPGVDGEADARLGRADPGRGRAARRTRRAWRDLPPCPLQPALSTGLLEERRGRRADVRR